MLHFSERSRRMVFSAVLGALVFGTWAFFANFDVPERRAIAAMTQAAFSFFVSFVVVALAELLFVLLEGRRLQLLLSIALPWASSVTGGYLVHRAAHTPSVGMTLLAPATAGLVFGTLYVLRLRQLARRMPRAQPSTFEAWK